MVRAFEVERTRREREEGCRDLVSNLHRHSLEDSRNNLLSGVHDHLLQD